MLNTLIIQNIYLGGRLWALSFKFLALFWFCDPLVTVIFVNLKEQF